MIRILGKQSLSYAVGLTVSKLQVFVVLLVLTRFLLPNEFGAVETLATLSMAVTVFTTLGLDVGLGSYFYEQTSDTQLQNVASSALWANGTLSGVFCLICAGLSNTVAQILFGTSEFALLVFFSCLTGVLRSANHLHWALLRLRFRTRAYNFLSVVEALGLFLISIWFVAELNLGVGGLVVANLLVSALTVLVAGCLNRSDLFHKPSLNWAMRLLKLGLPTVPFAVFAWALASFDRSILAATRSLEEVGIYGAAARIAAIANFALGPFQVAWWSFGISVWKHPNAQETYVRIVKLMVMLSGAIVVLIALASPLMITWLLPIDYAGASRYVGILAASSIFLMLSYVAQTTLMHCKKGWVMSFAFGIGALLNLILCLWWIPAAGIAGATWATLIGYIAMIVVAAVWANVLNPVKYPFLPLGLALMTVILIASIPFFLPADSTAVQLVHLCAGVSIFIACSLRLKLIDIRTITAITRSQLSKTFARI